MDINAIIEQKLRTGKISAQAFSTSIVIGQGVFATDDPNAQAYWLDANSNPRS